MVSVDVVIAGGGVAGLLIASALPADRSVIVIEQADSLPRHKYWLTDATSASRYSRNVECVAAQYDFLDFVAYDGFTATVGGKFCLWDTDKLIDCLANKAFQRGVQILTGHRLYSIAQQHDGILVRANEQCIRARLLVDCMGFGSPLVGAKDVATITGYYVLYGEHVTLNAPARPIALDNVVIHRHPTFFELFPTAEGTAHAALILPARQLAAHRSLEQEFAFICSKSHYAPLIRANAGSGRRTYQGIIPVGRLHTPCLDRIVFFGEAGQVNPAASATGLSRMLHTFQDLANGIEDCLRRDTLRREDLLRATPPYLTRMNRVFQESVFESLLTYTSDDFLRLVQDLAHYPSDVVSNLVFGDFAFGQVRTLRLALDAFLRPRSVLASHVLKAAARYYTRRGSM